MTGEGRSDDDHNRRENRGLSMTRLLFTVAAGFMAIAAATTGAAAQGHDATAGCNESGPLPNQIQCYLEAAESEHDVTLCEGAYDFAVRFDCVSRFAEHSGDPAACERIPIRNNRLLLIRDSCISGVAAATRSAQLCGDVQLDVVRDACFFTQVVELNASPELCERITKTALKASCLEP